MSTLLTKVLGVSWRESKRPKSVKHLQGYEDAIARLRGVADVDEAEPIGLPVGYVPFQFGVKPRDMIGRFALRYLHKRGFTPDTIIHYGLGYGSSGQTLGRVIIPIGTNYWQARTIFSNTKPKYINPKSAKNGALFNAAALRYDPSFISEGAFSAMSLGRRALAILGKKPTRAQLARLVEAKTSTYHLHLDADNDYVHDLAEQLYKAGKRVRIQVYAEGDPNEGVKGEFLRVNGRLYFARRKLRKFKLHGHPIQ